MPRPIPTFFPLSLRVSATSPISLRVHWTWPSVGASKRTREYLHLIEIEVTSPKQIPAIGGEINIQSRIHLFSLAISYLRGRSTTNSSMLRTWFEGCETTFLSWCATNTRICVGALRRRPTYALRSTLTSIWLATWQIVYRACRTVKSRLGQERRTTPTYTYRVCLHTDRVLTMLIDYWPRKIRW